MFKITFKGEKGYIKSNEEQKDLDNILTNFISKFEDEELVK